MALFTKRADLLPQGLVEVSKQEYDRTIVTDSYICMGELIDLERTLLKDVKVVSVNGKLKRI